MQSANARPSLPDKERPDEPRHNPHRSFVDTSREFRQGLVSRERLL